MNSLFAAGKNEEGNKLFSEMNVASNAARNDIAILEEEELEEQKKLLFFLIERNISI